MKEHFFIARKKFSQRIMNSLKTQRAKRIREGEIYILKYEPLVEIHTDKWHQISLILVTEVTSTTVTGYNFFYMSQDVSSRVIKEALKTPKFRGSKFSFLLEKELADSRNYCYTKKTFQLSRIISYSQVKREDWEEIPEMDKKIFGNLNPLQLTRDWDLENAQAIEKNVKKKKDLRKNQKDENSYVVEEDLNAREVIFETKENTNLRDIRQEMQEMSDENF